MKISIIILSWNTKDLLKQCLESVVCSQPPTTNPQLLTTNHQPLEIEIIVVDNGSTDGSQEMVKSCQWLVGSEKLITFKLIENHLNLGFSKGNNIGIKAATGKYIMLLNSDTVVQEGAIEKLVDYLEKNPNSAVSPLLELPSGELQSDYYMRFPNLWQVLFYHNPIIRQFILKTPLKQLICQEAREEAFEVDQLPGAALMASREIWQKVGELDTDYQFFFEDVDWCWRAKKAGVKLIVVPQAKIVHLGGASWKKKRSQNKNAFYRQFFASMLLFAKKNYPPAKLKKIKIALAINFLITFKFSLFWGLIKTNLSQDKLWK